MQRWWKVWQQGIILSLSTATKSCRHTAHSTSLAPATVTSHRPWMARGVEAGNIVQSSAPVGGGGGSRVGGWRCGVRGVVVDLLLVVG
uniref:Secreted protein n=2 Tax=Oryza TaxID=4527 RepID=A0A0E0RDN9_ORYRU